MKLKTLFALVGGLTLAATFFACKKDDSTTSNSDACNPSNKGPLFTEVRTIIRSKCGGSGCHMNGQTTMGYNFDCDPSIVNGRSNIASEVNSNRMPISAPLSTAEKTSINNWIAAGGRITD